MPTKPLFFSLSVLVHLGLAALLGGSVILLLLVATGDQSLDLWAALTREIGNLLGSLSMPRRQPFILCMIADVVLLASLVGLWDARAITRGRTGFPIRAAVLGAVACSLFYIVAAQAVARYAPFRITPVGSMGILFSQFMIVLWNVMYIPISALAHKVNTLVFSRLSSLEGRATTP